MMNIMYDLMNCFLKNSKNIMLPQVQVYSKNEDIILCFDYYLSFPGIYFVTEKRKSFIVTIYISFQLYVIHIRVSSCFAYMHMHRVLILKTINNIEVLLGMSFPFYLYTFFVIVLKLYRFLLQQNDKKCDNSDEKSSEKYCKNIS